MTLAKGTSASVLTTVRISDFAAQRELRGDAFINHAFAKEEREQCLARNRPNDGLAARYAARASLTRACREHDVQPPSCADAAPIVHDARGAPHFLFGPTRSLHSNGRRFEISVSLAHDGDIACALVLMRESDDET